MRLLMRLLGLTNGPNTAPPPLEQPDEAELQQAMRDLEVAESLFREASSPRSVDVAVYRINLAKVRMLTALGRRGEPLGRPVPWLAGKAAVGHAPPAGPSAPPAGETGQEQV